ncbi:hypothetical protein HDV00_007580 [Rhizophlyctis rosea]|nr:hypothetical protein HDV00_007580 [Rhizophlyctis rosea]
MIQSRLTAYDIKDQLLPHTKKAKKSWPHPVWCFNRSGQTRTVLISDIVTTKNPVGGLLPAGTDIWIGGEHEDSYDPDFLIYNDVAVIKPDGQIHLFHYPIKDFPPTDFHTASLIDDTIYIIGSMGYINSASESNTRRKAQVCVLDLCTMSIRTIKTAGDDPGWISEHTAVVTTERNIVVTVREGKFCTSMQGGCEAGRWEFDLKKSVWTRLEGDFGWEQVRIVEDLDV